MNKTLEKLLPFDLFNKEQCTSLWLTLTNLCNIHCQYCFNYVRKNNEYMSKDMATNIINGTLKTIQDPECTTLSINYFGGEPTLNSEALLGCINYINDCDINAQQYLMTNGIMSENLLQKLLYNDIKFQVSFDGFENNLRFNKTFKKPMDSPTVKSIEILVKSQEHVTVRGTFHEFNTNSICNLVDFCDSKKIKNLKIAPICDFGDAKTFGIKPPDINIYVDNYVKAKERANQYGINLTTVGDLFENWKKYKMNMPFIWLPDGRAAMTITHASSHQKGFSKTQIAYFDQGTGEINVDQNRIHQMKHNFIKNREKYCIGCPIIDLCRGSLHVTPYATDTFVPERDYYFCNLAQCLYKNKIIS